MERRQVTGRRAKEMASNLIREVAGKKDRHSSSEQNKQVCWLVVGFYEGRSISKLQNSVILLLFKI